MSVKLCKVLAGASAVSPWSRDTHLPFGQQGGILEHVHDDDKELIHPLPHFQATHLQSEDKGRGLRSWDKDAVLGRVWWLTLRTSKTPEGEAGGVL